MCDMIDGYYDRYENNIVVARKEHTCDACGYLIPRGHRYHRVYFLWEGRHENVKRCLRCEEMFQFLRIHTKYEAAIDERLNCGETWESLYGGPPPQKLAALAFMTPGEAQVQFATTQP